MNVLVPTLLVTSALFGSGCVASNFQKASADTPAAIPLLLAGTAQRPIAAEVETVIVHDGPGSWKRRAYWDEYVIIVTNPGSAPLQILSAELIDARDERLAPGTDWKELERASADWWQRNATPENVALGAGMTVAMTGAGVSAFILPLALLAGSGPVAGIALGGMLLGGGSTWLLQQPSEDGERWVAAEFDRRRLDFPVTVRPGDTARGSAFFRVTPAPRKLVLSCRSGGNAHRITFDLIPLYGLHQKGGPAVPAAGAVGETGLAIASLDGGPTATGSAGRVVSQP